MEKVVSYDKIFSEEEKKLIKNDYINNNFSLKDLYEKYNIRSHSWLQKFLNGYIRTPSEAIKIAHKKYPELFKHTEESKQLMREKRLAWMKANPEKTAWRLKNMSYPEKCFQKILKDNDLDKKYLIYREYSVFPYFIDFAFIDVKVAVEIDGSQHLEEDRKKRDEEKDDLLKSKGWRILRISSNEVIRDGKNALDSLLSILGDNNIIYSKVGILKAPKLYKKVSRDEDGLSEKQRLNALKQRKVERPNKERLFEMIKTMSFVEIAKQYGVSDKAITKWCKSYGLPHRKKDLKM